MKPNNQNKIKMKKKLFIVFLLLLLAVSVYFNIKPGGSNTWFVSFADANTRETYNSIHHIKQAQQLATGKGIKVGIIGKYFGYATNKDLYAGGKDFTGNIDAFENIAEHGLWMATTLKEIAPDVQIYALCARDQNRANEAEAITEAIDWAIENDIDILTYSAEAFRQEERLQIDKAVKKAIEHGIVTTFIHYDLPENILPNGLFPSSPKSYAREADLNVFHFDFNVLFLFKYENYLKSDRNVGNNIGDQPYFSNSSMSLVLAAIVSMMKEVNNDLTPADYKKILIETSKEIKYNGYTVKHVVDAHDAINYLLKMNETTE
ncbi:MAG: peptidase [Bacteroidetes bacterium HGW-Bacteroidetes-17]|nr:MAG: peptidase [Bacteroidetes bacterium HGW-Bacteroidetes-17]